MRTAWPPPPARPALLPGEVHVWAVDLDAPPLPAAHLHASLSSDERARLARFRGARHQRRYAVGRGTLRTILARYLAAPPASVRLGYGARGKPALKEPGSGIYFNVAHADRLFLCAVAGVPDIGIDVERAREIDQLDSLAQTCFSAAELAALRSLGEAHRTRAFFAAWTRKEAFIKALGEGLSYPLHAFDVSLAPDEVPRILAVRGASAAADAWVLRALDPGEPYFAALVSTPPVTAVRCWFWREPAPQAVVLAQRCCANAAESPPERVRN